MNLLPARELPERIGRLDELAHNLWWSWHPRGRELFRALDYPIWRMSDHNPVKQIRQIDPDRLQALSSDPAFLALYDSAMSSFDSYMSSRNRTWFATNYGSQLSGPIAYFSMEFAIHVSLPIYAGGLGVLAGDVCKEASDIGLPLVGVGFMYPQGYFHQHISDQGWQQEVYQELNPEEAPIRPVYSAQGGKKLAQVQLADRLVYLGARRVQVGRVDIYLLTTDLEENSPQDRALAARLYSADLEMRIQQEILLGIGGVRVLRALGIQPSFWHANEGHAAFMTIERVREEVGKGTPSPQALQNVTDATVFTTHTPLPSGSDVFPVQLIEKYFPRCQESIGIDRDTFLDLGSRDGAGEQTFNMTVLGLKMAGQRNAVSRLNGEVSRRLWHSLWPQLQENEVPISHVTNGIHIPTWVAPELGKLYEKYLGKDWLSGHDDPSLWDGILGIPDDELWATHMLLKRKLVSAIRERARKSFANGSTAQHALARAALLDPEVLTIAFVRRITDYKRPTLLFYDLERLQRIVKNSQHPVQIVFAGRCHPNDDPSKRLLQSVYSLATGPQFESRIAFVEDYELHMAHYLTQGVDVWLNTPRRLQESSGTSGMKAALNGVLQLSIRDGWWHEGFSGANGWAIGDDLGSTAPQDQDRADAESLYRLLEERIVPLYYNRDINDVPRGWVALVRETIRSIAPTFCTRRMMKEYIQQIYLADLKSGRIP